MDPSLHPSLGEPGRVAPSEESPERYAALLVEAARIHGVSLWQDAWRRLRRNWAAMGSLAFLVLLSLAAALTPLLPLQSPIEQDLKHRKFLPPNTQPVQLELAGLEEERFDERLHQLWYRPNFVDRGLIRARVALFGDWAIPSICGTDHLGRDLLARVLWGARVSLVVGVVATFVSLLIGVTYGAVAGYWGGWLDNAMMRAVDVLYSIPFIFVVIFILTVLGDSADQQSIARWLDQHYIDRIVVFYVLIGAIYWLTMARVVRGQVLSVKNEQFIEAARTIGASRFRIVFRHLIPNVMSVVIVYLTLTIPAVMLFEAFLSFLGLGVSPPNVSWGLLANDGIKVITPVQTYWWLVLFPGLALAMTLFALNFLGDGLRDALDPRLKNR